MVETMTKRERVWVLKFGLVVVVLTTLPYLISFVSQGETWVFTGFVYGVEDGNSYIAKMLQGSSGSWLFRSPYSSMPQNGVLAFLPFLLLGKLAAGQALHLQLIVLFHLFRIGTSFFALIATYTFISIFIKQEYWRRWATVVVTVGGGLGWVLILVGQSNFLGSLPLEWYSPEWFGFLSHYGLPHMLLARGLLLTGLTFYLSASRDLKRGWYAGIVFFILGLVHPLSLVSMGVIVGAHQVAIGVISWKGRYWGSIKRWLVIAFRSLIVPAPIVLYTALQFTTDPFLQAWTDQNIILSPHPAHILVAYGMMLIAGALGVRKLLRIRRWTGSLLLSWIVILPILAYAPHNLQRRFPEGIWVAIVTLAALGLTHYFNGSTSRAKQIGNIALLLSIPSALLLIFGGIQVSLKPSTPIFRPVDETRIFEWLLEQDDPDMVILSTYKTGNALPAWAPGFVVVGHGPESANLLEFMVKVNAYYRGTLSLTEQINFIQNQGIDYVILGPEEKAIGENQLEDLEYLELGFEVGDYQVYQVIESQGGSQ